MENPETETGKEHQLLTPFQKKTLNAALAQELRPEYKMRIQIMLLAEQGKSQTQICQSLGCSQATARHWVLVARSGQAHSWKEQPIGRPKRVNQAYLERLKELVTSSPKEHGYSFKCWTAGWLKKHLAKECGVEISERHINRLLKQMGLSTRGKRSTCHSCSVLVKGRKISIRDL